MREPSSFLLMIRCTLTWISSPCTFCKNITRSEEGISYRYRKVIIPETLRMYIPWRAQKAVLAMRRHGALLREISSKTEEVCSKQVAVMSSLKLCGKEHLKLCPQNVGH